MKTIEQGFEWSEVVLILWTRYESTTEPIKAETETRLKRWNGWTRRQDGLADEDPAADSQTG